MTCYERFEDQWKLNRHLGDAHREKLKCPKSLANGEYACRICLLPHKTLFMLKKHVYWNHSEFDVKAKYLLSVEDYIGECYLDRFRDQVFRLLTKGKLQDHLEALLTRDKEFKIQDLDYGVPISIDTDPVNAEKRRHLYLLWRDVLMKLA